MNIIKDYTKYESSKKERLLFAIGGYIIIAVIIYLFYHSVVLSIVSGGTILWFIPLYEDYLVRRRMNELNLQFKDLLYSLSASVASGRQMGEALIEAREHLSLLYSNDKAIMIELNHMCSCITENNESDAVLLSDFADRTHNEDIGNFVQVYITCRSLGGDLEKIIERTSRILNDKMAIKREIEALTAQKKIEGRMITIMPLLMLFLLNIASPSYIAPMYETFVGHLIMTLCLGGIIWGCYMLEKLSYVEL